MAAWCGPSSVREPVCKDRHDQRRSPSEPSGRPFELRAYDVEPDDLAAETVAQKIRMSAEQVFKNLVASGDKHGVCLAVVPGNCELDLKALAKTTGDKKIELVLLKEDHRLKPIVNGMH